MKFIWLTAWAAFCCGAVLAAASLILAPPKVDRSIYDVNWEDVGWCVYARFDPGYTPPSKMARIVRFCTVVGEGTYVES